jgi:glutamate racemase
MSASSPIVVLDSGLGGLTVVRALMEAAPGEQVLYFGDTARLPYGNKTADTVTDFVRQIVRYLLPWRPKQVIIACNTASALALAAVRASFPGLAITGVIEPGAKAAAIAGGTKQSPTIGIIATEATIGSKAYDRAIHRRRNYARLLLRPTPLLVPMIEDGRKPDDPLVRLALKQYLQPFAKHPLDVLVLGCTHYPIYKEVIQQMLGSHIGVIDSAQQCAEDVTRRLASHGLLRTAMKLQAGAGSTGAAVARTAPAVGSLRCFVTDDPARFQRLAPRFLGSEIDPPIWVRPQELYAREPMPLSESA